MALFLFGLYGVDFIIITVVGVVLVLLNVAVIVVS